MCDDVGRLAPWHALKHRARISRSFGEVGEGLAHAADIGSWQLPESCARVTRAVNSNVNNADCKIVAAKQYTETGTFACV